ncbi:hypothetical protein HFP71_13770 [Streptomyces sp. ARC32]
METPGDVEPPGDVVAESGVPGSRVAAGGVATGRTEASSEAAGGRVRSGAPSSPAEPPPPMAA